MSDYRAITVYIYYLMTRFPKYLTHVFSFKHQTRRPQGSRGATQNNITASQLAAALQAATGAAFNAPSTSPGASTSQQVKEVKQTQPPSYLLKHSLTLCYSGTKIESTGYLSTWFSILCLTFTVLVN